ncbi:putative quinol monooxygenase [Microbacterium allomyrinae]|uniref:Antibiotic biosynthesis monooxygenase n=1 Tax=Microbacterium allomyrinae TaxID=2830666 RepID=A0A9X1LWV9_9MICO|nr:putative quinol monooxygenase [Microbacterium allomyrinae]MCC2033243.1 antibiotic biosynthesis monooxygenase [Microbacterium allomyrinae]
MTDGNADAADAVTVVARLHPDPARFDEAVAAVGAAVAGIRDEPGCQQYDPHVADDGSILIVERWSSREALAAHNVGAAVQVLRDGVAGLMSAPTQVTVAVAL